MNDLPMADAVPQGTDIEKLRKSVKQRNLAGLANTTKWNELITTVRKESWRPSYRSKSISGYISEWDVEWFYHLPFPFLMVEWFDISLDSIDPDISTSWLLELVLNIGFEFEVKNDILRIWGYGPKSYDNFE
jgi:hypothetical protein